MVYDISYKFLIGAKPLCIRFHKAVYDGNRYLALFSPEKFDAIYNEIRYLISQTSGIAYAFSNNYARANYWLL